MVAAATHSAHSRRLPPTGTHNLISASFALGSPRCGCDYRAAAHSRDWVVRVPVCVFSSRCWQWCGRVASDDGSDRPYADVANACNCNWLLGRNVIHFVRRLTQHPRGCTRRASMNGILTNVQSVFCPHICIAFRTFPGTKIPLKRSKRVAQLPMTTALADVRSMLSALERIFVLHETALWRHLAPSRRQMVSKTMHALFCTTQSRRDNRTTNGMRVNVVAIMIVLNARARAPFRCTC